MGVHLQVGVRTGIHVFLVQEVILVLNDVVEPPQSGVGQVCASS